MYIFGIQTYLNMALVVKTKSTRGKGKTGSSTSNVAAAPTPSDDYAPSSFGVNGGAQSSIEEKQSRKKNINQPKSSEELRQTMRIIQTKVDSIMDNLQAHKDKASLKVNVEVTIKHLGQIGDIISNALN